jgi:hypothetical protein
MDCSTIFSSLHCLYLEFLLKRQNRGWIAAPSSRHKAAYTWNFFSKGEIVDGLQRYLLVITLPLPGIFSVKTES